MTFQKNLLVLSDLASQLPLGLCTPQDLPVHRQPPPVTTATLDLDNMMDSTTNNYYSSTVSTENSTVTAASKSPSKKKHDDDDEQIDQQAASQRLNAGLIKIWIAMQNTLCGHSVVTTNAGTGLGNDIIVF